MTSHVEQSRLVKQMLIQKKKKEITSLKQKLSVGYYSMINIFQELKTCQRLLLFPQLTANSPGGRCSGT
jgi:hypothetical protein